MPRGDAPSLVSSESRGYAYDLAQNLAKRTNNAAGSTVTATVNALNQLTAGLGFSGSLVYDRRGNLLSIGSTGSGKAFAYDHENQCVSAGGFNAYNKSDFVYDGKGRLRKRTDYTWNGSSWSYSTETRYVYDGMLLLQERTGVNQPAVTYTRGVDLSGSLAGAGGIGGLLARTAHQSTSPYQPSTHACYHADGSGNVTYLLRPDRTHGASYRYDPYGRLIASSGPLAAANLMRFSSKPWHDHSETYYYGYRFYVPEAQRWPNRDPFGSPSSQFNAKLFGSAAAASYEEGIFHPELLPEGPNLYAYAGNDPVNLFDSDGEVVPIIAIGVVVARAGFLAYRYHRSLAAAAVAARAGQSLIARNRATAQAIACRAGQGAPPIRHAPHGPPPGFLPHYHPNPNVTPPHTHIWWGRQPLESYPRIPSGHPSVP